MGKLQRPSLDDITPIDPRALQIALGGLPEVPVVPLGNPMKVKASTPTLTDRLANAFSDPNIQQLLLTLGGNIGGQGSVGASIGAAGTQYLQGRLEGEAAGRLLGGEDSASVFGDSRFNSLSPEARTRIATQSNQEQALGNDTSRAQSDAERATADLITADAAKVNSETNKAASEANIRQSDTQIENQNTQFYQKLESDADLQAASLDVQQRINAADNATTLAANANSVARTVTGY